MLVAEPDFGLKIPELLVLLKKTKPFYSEIIINSQEFGKNLQGRSHIFDPVLPNIIMSLIV